MGGRSKGITTTTSTTTTTTTTTSTTIRTKPSSFTQSQHSQQQQQQRWLATTRRGRTTGSSNTTSTKQQHRGPRLLSNQQPKTANYPKEDVAVVEASWYTPTQALSATSLDMGRYGLKRLDYTKLRSDSYIWQLPPHPPNKSWADRIIYPTTIFLVFAVTMWVYFNPEEEDIRDYWKRVESGQILVEDDDDEDDDDDDDDDDDNLG